ncbi:MAG TPA: hypothetical protein VE978_22890 [Chitinophagales bacterium]|nr:hypothetical protein [Chitinophagales bacterium]
MKTIRSQFQQEIGKSIINSLVKRGEQFGIADFQLVAAQLDYNQAKGDYTQRGGGNYIQGGGNYNQAMVINRDALIDPAVLSAELVRSIVESKTRGF